MEVQYTSWLESVLCKRLSKIYTLNIRGIIKHRKQKLLITFTETPQGKLFIYMKIHLETYRHINTFCFILNGQVVYINIGQVEIIVFRVPVSFLCLVSVMVVQNTFSWHDALTQSPKQFSMGFLFIFLIILLRQICFWDGNQLSTVFQVYV